jgi:hypothetical protein
MRRSSYSITYIKTPIGLGCVHHYLVWMYSKPLGFGFTYSTVLNTMPMHGLHLSSTCYIYFRAACQTCVILL